jgi:hypothetical protein
MLIRKTCKNSFPALSNWSSAEAAERARVLFEIPIHTLLLWGPPAMVKMPKKVTGLFSVLEHVLQSHLQM